MPPEIGSTYRLQLHAEFGFGQAAELADYLAELGISHAYCSPYLQAVPGSTHGYDVVDSHRVNDELGGESGHRLMCEAFGRHHLGQVLDIVPNHMAIHPRNAWWWDLLENGPSSAYERYFDVAWRYPETREPNRLLMPVLGERYGRAIESKKLRIERRQDTFSVTYAEHRFPLHPESVERLRRLSGSGSREAIDEELERINADPEALDEILEAQYYRLGYWRAARSELDYRRFFDINTLVALCIEHEEVFRDTHRRILEWLSDGTIDGVRVDHPDGLRDPEQYLHRLRQASPSAWIVVEKILEPGERLPESWPVAGTTGYDFLNRLNGIFVDPRGERPLTDFYAELTGEPTDYEELVCQKKELILRLSLGSDLERLTLLFLQISQRHRRSRDFTREELGLALREVMVCLPVYRTYVREGANAPTDSDRRTIERSVARAKRRRPELDSEVLSFLRDLLLLRVPGEMEQELVMRFQQLSGPAMAKGVEDTAFYGYHRLVSLNEVGGDPGRFGLPLEAFHRACQEAQERWPLAMLSTSTHDTKRSEDVRARINLLSEIPDAWMEAVRRWTGHNEKHRSSGRPDRNAEYLLYQILVGAWPIETDRAAAYMEKAAREAKQHTSWNRPVEAYERALLDFVRAVLEDREFTRDLSSFVEPLIEPGRIHSLSQSLIKLTAPGIPDVYRGTELWDLSLVDPDNRRPVDYKSRRRLLAAIGGMTPEAIWADADSGAPKLWTIRQALHLRKRRPEPFGARSSYQPLDVQGPEADRVVAFDRGGEVLTIVPRLVLGLDDWRNTTVHLPAGRWRNELTGDSLQGGRAPISDLLARFPVALLARDEG